MNIEIIAGSPRLESITKRVAINLHSRITHTQSANVGLIDLAGLDIPSVGSVWNTSEEAPSPLRQIVERVLRADAFVLTTPEFNGSFSPTLKTFLDHFPKQTRRVFGIVTASPGYFGGIRAALQMQPLLIALGGIVSPRMLIIPEVEKRFSFDGNLLDASLEESVVDFVDDFFWLTKSIHTARHAGSPRLLRAG